MGSGYLVRRGVVGGSSEATVTFDIQNVKIFRKGLISLRFPVYLLAATTVGNYALFGGGIYSSSYFSTVNAYDSNLVRSIPTELSVGRGYLAATTVGNYALFGGGQFSSASNIVDAYDSNLVRSTPTELNVTSRDLAATTIGDYALFGGGSNSSYGGLTYVTAYDSNLVRSTSTELSVARSDLAATFVGDYALFGGGYTGSSYSSTVDAYDSNLVRSSMDNLLEERCYLAATTVGKYALFGGGTDAYVSDDVDIYTFDSTIQVYPGTKYKFNNMVEEETATEWKEITFDEPLNGYIKISNAEIN